MRNQTKLSLVPRRLRLSYHETLCVVKPCFVISEIDFPSFPRSWAIADFIRKWLLLETAQSAGQQAHLSSVCSALSSESPKKKKESQVRKIVDTLRFTWLKCDHSRVWPCTLSPFHRCGSFFSTFYWFRIRIGIKFRLNFATKMSFGTRDTWRLKGESRIYWVNIYFEQMRRPRNSSINISRKAQTLTKHHWCQLGNHVIICDLKKWKWGKPSFWRFMLISIRVVCDGNHANMAVKLGCTFMSEEILRGLMSHWLKSLIKLFKLLILLDELHEL